MTQYSFGVSEKSLEESYTAEFLDDHFRDDEFRDLDLRIQKMIMDEYVRDKVKQELDARFDALCRLAPLESEEEIYNRMLDEQIKAEDELAEEVDRIGSQEFDPANQDMDGWPDPIREFAEFRDSLCS